MTLIELLIAITILATLTGLLSALWGQLADWAQENQYAGETLKTQRAIDFLHGQWDARRDLLPLEEDGDRSWLITPDELRFITSTPALFSEWPLVVAKLTIEEDPSLRRTTDGRPFMKLFYEETRLIDMGAVSDQQRDLIGNEMKQRIMLLDDCGRLQFESLDLPAAARARLRAGADDDELSPWRPVEFERVIPEALQQDDEEDVGPPKAIRLVGERRGEEFACELIAEASR